MDTIRLIDVAIAIAVVLLISLLAALNFHGCGLDLGRDAMKQEAVNEGHAEWTIDDEGNKGWQWLPINEPKTEATTP